MTTITGVCRSAVKHQRMALQTGIGWNARTVIPQHLPDGKIAIAPGTDHRPPGVGTRDPLLEASLVIVTGDTPPGNQTSPAPEQTVVMDGHRHHLDIRTPRPLRRPTPATSQTTARCHRYHPTHGQTLMMTRPQVHGRHPVDAALAPGAAGNPQKAAMHP